MNGSKLVNRLYRLFSLWYYLMFIVGGAGKEYGVGPLKKFFLTLRILWNHRKYRPLATKREHLLLVEEILSLPKSMGGDVVECGCFDGSSTVSLSLACGLTNRRLFVCDSFEGLPPPQEDEKYTIHAYSRDYYTWEEGDYKSQGGIEAVKRNVAKSGDIRPCVFVKGYFKDTLKNLETNAIALVFEDADLRSSVEDCLRYLWPKMQVGAKFYCHEPWSMEVVSLFFDRQWWQENLGTAPPGFFGSGKGVMVGFRHYPGIGYSVKLDPEMARLQGKKIVSAGSEGFEEGQEDKR